MIWMLRGAKLRRFISLMIAMLAFASLLFIIMLNLNNNMELFVTPKNIVKNSKDFYLGGLVKVGSYRATDTNVEFSIIDDQSSTRIIFHGIVPPLFKEGSGVVAYGHLHNDIFLATRVLAKHDEVYMPKEIYKQLRDKKFYRK